MNSELDVKGVTLDSGATTSEAFSPTPPLNVEVARSSHPNSMSGYDFYWDCGQYQATNADILKEKVLLSQLPSQGQHQPNGPFEAAIKDIPIEPSSIPKALKLYDDRTNSSGSLDFDPYNLCSPQKIHFDMVHATPSFSPSPELTRIMVEEVHSFPYPFDHQYGQCNSQPHLVELEEADLDLFCGKEYEDVVGILNKESESRESCDNDVSGCIEPKTEELKVDTSQDIPTHIFFSYDGNQSLENSLNFNVPLKEIPHDPALVEPSTSSHHMGEVNNKASDCQSAEVKMSLKQDVSAFSLTDSTLAPSFESLNLFKSSLNETQTSASLLMTAHTPSLRKDSDNEADAGKDHDTAAEKILSNLVMSSLMLSDIEGERAAASTSSLESFTHFRKPVKKAQTQAAFPVTSSTPSSTKGQGKYMRRRVTDESELRIPLQYGWKREIRIKTVGNRLHGETTYYAPCGKKLRQFPDVIKYLIRNGITELGREHFSFSPRMNVGEFFEMKESPEGDQWYKLSAEETPLRIQAMMSRRGRPPNSNKQWVQKLSLLKRGKGKSRKTRTVTLLDSSDAKLMKKLEQQAVLNPKETQILKALMNKLKQKGSAKMQKANRMKEEKEMKRQQKLKQQRLQLLHEMKKPTEDLYLTDHKPLPEFNRIAGLVLSGRAFSDCLTVFEFLHTYGKVLGFNVLKDMPTLNTLQEGLLNVGDTVGSIQDLLIKLLHIAIVNPGLPNQYQSITLLRERIRDVQITRNNVSEVLRIFLEAYGVETELCESLKSKSFQAHSSEKKASVLAFLVNELLENSLVIREIDKNLYQRANIRKNKWIVDGKLRRLRRTLAKKKGFEKLKSIMEDRRRKQGISSDVDHNSTSVGSGDEERVRESTRGKSSEKKTEGIKTEHEQPSTSVSELSCQIEKLSKRQIFFARKLLQFSQKLRALLLGRDRFRRRYWVFPHLSGVFVEGSEELAATEEGNVEKNQPQHLESAPVKVHVGDALSAKPSTPIRPKDDQRRKCEANPAAPESPKRQRANVKCGSGLQQEAPPAGQPHSNLEQLAVFLAWLSVLQNSVSDLSIPTPQCSTSKDSLAAFSPEVLLASNRKLFDLSVPSSEQKVKDCAEKQGQWFSLLPRIPCDTSSVTQLPTYPQPALQHQSYFVDSDPNGLDCGALKPPAAAQPFTEAPFDTQFIDPLILDPASGTSGSTFPQAKTPATKEKVKPHPTEGLPQAESPWPVLPKRRGRPSKFLKEFSQCQLKPIPPEMQKGWWHIGSPEELNCLLKVLHPRGIREKALHKQLLKHMDYVNQACMRDNTDILFSNNNEEQLVTKEMVENWKPEKWAILADLEVLQYLEELEQRVISASLQVEGWSCPDTDSTRDDLVYFDQKCLTSSEGKVKDEEEMELMRRNNNPLDLAVSRLVTLELNIERRYLKEPLCAAAARKLEPTATASKAAVKGVFETEVNSNEGSIPPGLSLWRETLLKCTNAAQVFMCIQQLEKSIAWEKSVLKVSCQICRKGNKDDLLLLCDNCEQGCHTFCLKPKIVEIPEEDWFCPICISKANGQSVRPRLSRSKIKQRRDRKRPARKANSHSVEPGSLPTKGKQRRYRKRTENTVSNVRGVEYCSEKRRNKKRSNFPSPGNAPATKRRRISIKNDPKDLALCEVILMEMESHEDAWPFLHPVNPRMVPGYRKVIKKPMDFSTIRGKLIERKYTSCKEFAADAHLVFDNCLNFNENSSEIGQAGNVMKKFFESRWAEFYHSS
ncbi:bromodomain adjacent to zinc finger domain protein 2A-like isoform X2 [Pristis pectinata]|nr:bromodomain adjacent to zinc finger domain protein 2A-like isoform X2 [Pristis pectinata]XP_051865444.1 bromodomain adjacent to zinc finger domain protein 2A-like isoform X2 [Pristis pectinata]